MQRSKTSKLTTREKARKWLEHCRGSDRGFERGVFLNGVGAGRLEDMVVRAFVWGRRGVGLGTGLGVEGMERGEDEKESHASGLGELEWGIGKRILGVLMKK